MKVPFGRKKFSKTLWTYFPDLRGGHFRMGYFPNRMDRQIDPTYVHNITSNEVFKISYLRIKLRFVPRLRTPLFRWAFRGKFRAVPRLFRAPTARGTSGTGAERPFRACSATRGARSAVPPEPLVPRPAEQTGA